MKNSVILPPGLILQLNFSPSFAIITITALVWSTAGIRDFLCKGQMVNILGFTSHMISVITTQLCCCSRKATTENRQTNEHGCAH